MDTNEGYLTREQLTALDEQIDSLVPSFELLRTNRRLALRTLLTEFDAIVQLYGSEPNLAQRILAYRSTYSASDHAIRWILRHCPEASSFIPAKIEASAVELLTLARDYSYIFTQMSLAFRGRHKIRRTSTDRYLICSARTEDLELETARSLIAAGEYPDTHQETTDLPEDIADSLQRAISIDGINGRQLRYTFTESTYEATFATMETRRLYTFSMNPDWDLGGYSFGNLQRVWNTLKTLQSLHQLALQKLPRQADRRRLNLRIQSRDEWVAEISEYADLEFELVGRVFDDLIYDFDLHKSERKKGHVMYQPYFDLGNDEIVQCNGLVMMSAVEKCSWILTELLRPQIHDRLKTLKERHWIDAEFKDFESERLKVFPHLGFTHEGKRGDIDLLILDVDDNLALVAQLKWTTSADNVAGVISDDEQYAKGVKQAVRSLAWAENNRSELAHRIGMAKSALQSTIFRPILIAKETLPSGTFATDRVPVINESLFRWIMKKPHYATLKQLWNTVVACEYLPKEGVHFERHAPEPITWGNLEFTLEDVAYVPLRRWDPAIDLVIPT